MPPLSLLQNWASVIALIVLLVIMTAPFWPAWQKPLTDETIDEDNIEQMPATVRRLHVINGENTPKDISWELQRPNVDRPYDWDVDGI